jgi:hypothetical protein
VDISILLINAAAASLAAAQADGRALAEEAAVLMDCTVAAAAAESDAETEIAIAPELERAAYEEARRLMGLAADALRAQADEAGEDGAPRDVFFASQSADLTAGFLLGQAYAFALRDVNAEAAELADGDPELYADFFEARPWAGYFIYTDAECGEVLDALGAP